MDFSKLQTIDKADFLKYDKISEIQKEQNNKYHNFRDDQVFNKLKESGYIFSKIEFAPFLTERCELIREENLKNTLLVDGVVFLEWWDTVEISSVETDNDYRITAIFGKPNNKPVALDD